MQTPEKVNRQFVFKLLVLFTLLLSGAMLKTPKQTPTKESGASKGYLDPTAQKDGQQIRQIYHRLVNESNVTSDSF